jgi:hypothetical protein
MREIPHADTGENCREPHDTYFLPESGFRDLIEILAPWET